MNKYIKFACACCLTLSISAGNCAAALQTAQNNPLKLELNNALGVPQANPVYLIAVTRENNNAQNMIRPNDWLDLSTRLQYLCNLNPNNVCIVVFNEYFLKRGQPLIDTSTIGGFNEGPWFQQSVLELSQLCPNAIFYMNFLYRENDMRVNQHIIDLHNNANPMYAVTAVNVWNIPNPIGYISNVTKSFYNGQILTQYRKRSYFHEDDHGVDGGYVYDFGPGHDERGYQGNGGIYAQIRDILLKRVNTEICLDLALGVRRQNTSNIQGMERDLSLAIVQANSVSLNNNINNMPLSTVQAEVPICFVDPTPQQCGNQNTGGVGVLLRTAMDYNNMYYSHKTITPFGGSAPLLLTFPNGARIKIVVYALN